MGPSRPGGESRGSRVSLRCESVMRGRVSGRLEIRERRGEECQKWTLDSHEDIMRRGAGALPDHRDFLMFLCPQSLTLTTTSETREHQDEFELNNCLYNHFTFIRLSST